MCNNADNFEIAAAIDFGTTYSGVAYSYKDDQESVFTISQWPDGTTSSKIPTAILFDSDKKFLAFGQDAVTRFTELADEEEEKDYFYFHRFKMKLYSEENLTKDYLLESKTGKFMPALKVFSESIKYLKTRLVDSLNVRYSSNIITDDSIQWVLTVPAIWNDSAKQFMREAAKKAGLENRKLKIALEPEAASLYCFKSPKERMVSSSSLRKTNAKYLVVDNGGGTVDITAHHITDDNSVKELYKASGGAWGGTKVDELFQTFLGMLFTRQNIAEIQKSNPSQWEQITQDFEGIKKKIKNKDNDGTVLLNLVETFNFDHFQRLPERIRKGSTVKAQRLKIQKKLMAEMIGKVSKNIVQYVNTLIRDHLGSKVDFVVMVGGFSNSHIVIDDMKEMLHAMDIPVIIPEEAELAVMKGAVLTGWNHDFVKSRKMKKTYGIEIHDYYVDGVHPKEKLHINEFGEKRCKNVFDTLVTVNQSVDVSEVIKRTYTSGYKSAVKEDIEFYGSEKSPVKFTDEGSVGKIGTLIVPMPVLSSEKRYVDVEIMFGDAEISVKAHDRTSDKRVEAKFDFL